MSENTFIKCKKCGTPNQFHKVNHREKTEWFEDVYYTEY